MSEKTKTEINSAETGLVLTTGDGVSVRRYMEVYFLQSASIRQNSSERRNKLLDNFKATTKTKSSLALSSSSSSAATRASPTNSTPPPPPGEGSFLSPPQIHRGTSSPSPLANTLGLSPPVETKAEKQSKNSQQQDSFLCVYSQSSLINSPPLHFQHQTEEITAIQIDNCAKYVTTSTTSPSTTPKTTQTTPQQQKHSIMKYSGYTTPPKTTLSPTNSSIYQTQIQELEETMAAKDEEMEEEKGAFDWNEEFQKAKDEVATMNPNTHNGPRLEAYGRLAKIAEDFVRAATAYGRIIISEIFLPVSQKTIKPIPKGKAGFAGGEKYSVQNIFFKLAINDKDLYSTDEMAAKVAGHDMKSLIALSNLWEKGVCFPLTALVVYRGFTIIATARLPISHNTLIYGSDNGGITIKGGDSEINSIVKRVAQRLNLELHKVGKGEFQLYTCVDIEIHKGKDGRIYWLDFSRLMPPQTPNNQIKGCYLIELFRPEFLRNTKTVLCSDSYSNFVPDEEKQKHKTKIDDATNRLKHEVVKKFAEKLSSLQEIYKDTKLIQELHEAGINVRLLGLVFMSSENQNVKNAILQEMVSRVIKCDIARKLRTTMTKLRVSREAPYRTAVIELLNTVFGTSQNADKYWIELCNSLEKKFDGLLITHRNEIRTSIDLKEVFSRVSTLLGLRWGKTLWKNIKVKESWFNCPNPFLDADLEELQEKVKQLNIVEHSEGYCLRMIGLECRNNPARQRRLMKMAVYHFERALMTDPDNKVTLRNLGDCLSLLNEQERAESVYQRAIRVKPNDAITLFKYAIFLDKFGRLDEAEDLYLQSLESNTNHANCVYMLADFLYHIRGDVSEAEKMYKLALKVDKKNAHANNNYAVMLAIAKHEYIKAEKHFKAAIEASDNPLPEHKRNLEILLQLTSTLNAKPIIDVTPPTDEEDEQDDDYTSNLHPI